MEGIITFFAAYGWQLTLIAILGIVILGVLKYANAFNKVPSDKRKVLYFIISIGFSLIASATYLAIMGTLTPQFFMPIATAIYALNQTIYAIYDTTSLKDLWNKILDFIIDYIKTNMSQKKEENK